METLLVNFEYSSGEGHDACGWMAVEGWIRVNVPPLSLRLDSRNPFTVLCLWFVEGWSVDTRFLRWISSALYFSEPVNTPAWGKGGGKARRGLRILADMRSILAARVVSSLPVVGIAGIAGSRFALKECFASIFRSISRVFLLRISCTRLFEPHAPHPGYAPAIKNDNAWIDARLHASRS